MSKVKLHVEHPNYGDVELNVDRVIAVSPEKHILIFEEVLWHLDAENFAKVYEVWKGTKKSTGLDLANIGSWFMCTESIHNFVKGQLYKLVYGEEKGIMGFDPAFINRYFRRATEQEILKKE